MQEEIKIKKADSNLELLQVEYEKLWKNLQIHENLRKSRAVDKNPTSTFSPYSLPIMGHKSNNSFDSAIESDRNLFPSSSLRSDSDDEYENMDVATKSKLRHNGPKKLKAVSSARQLLPPDTKEFVASPVKRWSNNVDDDDHVLGADSDLEEHQIFSSNDSKPFSVSGPSVNNSGFKSSFVIGSNGPKFGINSSNFIKAKSRYEDYDENESIVNNTSFSENQSVQSSFARTIDDDENASDCEDSVLDITNKSLSLS